MSVTGFGTVTWEKGDNAGVVAGLHDAGITVVCYLNSGAWESYRPDADLFSRAASSGIRRAGAVSAGSTCAHGARGRSSRSSGRGCDSPRGSAATASTPTRTTRGATIRASRWPRPAKRWYLRVAAHAHRLGLSVGMKNGVEVIDADTVAAFDWALDEECSFFHECGLLRGFVDAGKAVFQTEYVADWRRRGLDKWPIRSAPRPGSAASRPW